MRKPVSSVALADVAELNPKINETIQPETQVSFVPMAAVTEVTGEITIEEIRQYADVVKGFTPFKSDDIIVAKITPCFQNGKIAYAKLSRPYGFGSTEFHVIRADTKRLLPRYVFHFLRQDYIRVAGERRMTGSAGQRRVPLDYLASLELPLPPLPEQKRIAEILDGAEALRAKRRAALALLDELTQSIFLDMFGDPVTNPKGWHVGCIRDLLETASYGTSEKSAAVGEFPVLRMNNITRTGEMDFTDLKYMNLKPSEHDRYLVRSGDVLFNRTNSAELVGKTGVFRGKEKMAFAGYLIRLRTNAANDPEYLSAFLNSDYAKKMLRKMCKSIIGMANINATEIQDMSIALPPTTLQRSFAARMNDIEKVRAVTRQALIKFDQLFASLQHRAFRGEL